MLRAGALAMAMETEIPGTPTRSYDRPQSRDPKMGNAGHPFMDRRQRDGDAGVLTMMWMIGVLCALCAVLDSQESQGFPFPFSRE